MDRTAEVIDDLIAVAGRRLGAYGYVLTGSVDAGQELVQDAIVKVLIRRRRIDNVHAAEGYVRAAMRTLHIDAMRREVAWRRLLPRVASQSPVTEPAEGIDSMDTVERLLAELPVQMRTALALHYVDDLPVSEVAAVMHLSIGTVKRHLHDGRKRLEPFAVEWGLGERIAVIERS